MDNNIKNIEVGSLIAFARAWSRLGRSTQEELEELLDQGEAYGFHPQSVRTIRESLGCYSHEIRETCEEWLEAFEAANKLRDQSRAGPC